MPNKELTKVYYNTNERFPGKEMSKKTWTIWWVFLGEKAANPFTYLFYKYSKRWGAKHGKYIDEEGAINSSAAKVAIMWEKYGKQSQKMIIFANLPTLALSRILLLVLSNNHLDSKRFATGATAGDFWI